MSTSQEYLEDEKAKEFDEWVSRAHRARRYIMNPSAGGKGSSLLEKREEKGFSLIADRFKRTAPAEEKPSKRSK